ncbi:MAG: hypothetical protein HUJ54_05965 [Erysipelotrichaceae bacterium]|nr:hypothetical protein [Erysipelotrichaceae bacterium]
MNEYTEFDFPYEGKYTFVDVEIPNLNNNCICAISLIVVEDKKEVVRHTELINPKTYFSSANIKIHGIKRKDVLHSRTLAAFWKDYGKYFSKDYVIAAHNTNSDISVLKKDLSRLQMKMEAEKYLDTMDIMADFYFKGTQQKGDLKLDSIARRLGIYLDHHNPESDVNACYEVIRYMENYHDLDIASFIKPIPEGKPKVVFKKKKPPVRKVREFLAEIKKKIALKDPELDIQKNTAEIKGDRCYRHGDYFGIVQNYEIAIAKKSKSMGIYIKLAETYEELGMYPEASRVLNTGISRMKQSKANYYPLRRALQRLRKRNRDHTESAEE